MKRRALILSLLLGCLWLVPFAHAQLYSVADVGTLGGSYSGSTGINDFGQVVGYSEMPDHVAIHAFMWTQQNGLTDLHPQDGSANWSYGAGINNQGQVVGVASFSVPPSGTCLDMCFESHAFLWSSPKGMKDIGTIGNSSAANGINMLGQVVGDSIAAGHDSIDPFLWTKTDGMQDLGSLGNGSGSAQAINDFGRVVGGSSTGDSYHAFSWTRSKGLQDIGTICGAGGQAAGVNNRGHVVGTAFCDGGAHGFFWSPKNGMQDIGMPDGSSLGGPGKINIYDMVVGSACPQSCLSQESVHAYVWTKQTGWVDLNTLIPADSGWVLENVSGINMWGQITGQGYKDGQYHAFVLTPPPLAHRLDLLR